MQKSALGCAKPWPQALLKTLLVMKLAIFIVLFTALQVKASPSVGQSINLSIKNTEIKKVLKTIERDGDFRFLFNSDLKDISKKVDFSATGISVSKALDQLFVGTNLTYKLLNNNLVVVLSTDAAENAEIKVTGKVTGEGGAALSGASVQAKGGKGGTSTDNYGNYTITVDNNATLVFSNIGYETQEVKVNNNSVIDVRLVLSVKKSDEVVVIGYGTASRRDLTGSIAKVTGAEIASQPNANPLSSLQGKVSGLSIINNADPGATPDVRIRGTVSIGTLNPLYIVDGIFVNNLDFVNPSEIESVEVLKDASSLAIFGFKGGGGAIVVTTKKAKAGQLNINFNSTIGVKKLVDKIKLANGDQFRALIKAEAASRFEDEPNSPGGQTLNNFVNNELPSFTGNTDWIDAVTRKAIYNTSNLSVDGASEKNRFHIGLGYSYDEGLVKHTKYERLNVNVSDEYRVSSRLKIGFTVIATREHLPYNSGALENARRSLPVVSDQTKSFYVKNPYGVDSGYYNLYSSTPSIQNSETNPLATLEKNWNKKIDYRYRYVGNVFAELNITKELSVKGTWYANISNEDDRTYTPLYYLYNPAASTAGVPFLKNSLTAVEQNLTNQKTFQQDYLLNYKKKFGGHSLAVTAGFTTFYFKNDQVFGQNAQPLGGRIIPDDKRFWYLQSGFGASSSVARSYQNEYTTVSGLARVIYNYKAKYFLNGSYRKDYASQINDDISKQGQSFWAIGAAWEISKEKFMEKQHIFDMLKLKGSVGELGNFNPAGRDYPAYPGVSSNSSAVFGGTLIPVNFPDYIRDPNLHWETVSSAEVGFEADLLKNKLHVEAVYYSRTTNDILKFQSGQGTGVLPTLRNFGSIKNSGLELSASYTRPLMKDLTLTVGGNLTTFKNKVTKLDAPNRPNISSNEQTPNQVQVGYPVSYFYGLVVEGVYQSYADILASPVSNINGGGAKPGDLKYKDLNGDGLVTDADRTNIGNPTPDFTYAFNIALKYKNFDLGIDLGGSYGNEIYRVWGTSEQKNSVYNFPEYYTGAWSGAGTSASVPIVNQLHLINRAPSTYGIEDGSYIRIRNLTLGYSVNKLPKMTRIKNIRLAFAVQNLKTWKHNEGYSPEFGGDATGFGMDFGGSGSALPRITTFSLNVNF